jgi:hypothetical protein
VKAGPIRVDCQNPKAKKEKKNRYALFTLESISFPTARYELSKLKLQHIGKI